MKQNRFTPEKVKKDSTGYVSPYRAKLKKDADKGDPYAREKLNDIRIAVQSNKLKATKGKKLTGYGP